MKQETVDGLKRAALETVYFFLLPFIACFVIGKSVFMYLMWTRGLTSAQGVENLYAIALAMAPFVVIVSIITTALFYWLNTKKVA